MDRKKAARAGNLDPITNAGSLDFLKKRWLKLWKRVEAKGDPYKIYAELITLYSDERRTYHNLDHITHCLKEFAAVKHLCEHPDEVEMAIWFHDAIYDPKAKDNEEKSAEFARQILEEMKALQNIADVAPYLILATKHIEPPKNIDAQVLADIDLSSLGALPEEFDGNSENIRKEYGLSEEQWKIGRAEFLKRFLAKPSIYLTEHFRQKYENRARDNLQRAINES